MTAIQKVRFMRFYNRLSPDNYICSVYYFSGRIVDYNGRIPATVLRYLCENSGYIPGTEWERHLIITASAGECHPNFSWETMDFSDDSEGGRFNG